VKDLQTIEKAIIKKYRKEIYSKVVRAIKDFDLIEENDKIAVCISGGKDSFLMAKCMQEIKRHNKIPFELKFIVMDPGYDIKVLEHIRKLASDLKIEIDIFKSSIFEVIKNNENPCFLCARMRRGFLYNKAQDLGCNKIALGHHFNDVIETILLNQIYNGQFSGMLPILDSDNFENMKLIRPLYYVKEKDIISWGKFSEIEFIDCACSATKKNLGKRKEIKKLTEDLLELYKNSDINIFNSMFNVNKQTTRETKK